MTQFPRTRSRLRRPAVAFAMMTVVVGALAGCAAGATTDDAETSDSGEEVTVRIMLGPGEDVPFNQLERAAEEAGVFEEAGVVTEWSAGLNGQELTAALVSGGTDFALQVTNAALGAVAQGECLKFLTTNSAQYVNLIGRADIELEHDGEGYPDSALDLKGKSIGLVTLGGSQQAVVDGVLEEVGLTEADVTYVAVGPANTGIPALEEGQIDVYFGVVPSEQMIADYKIVVPIAGTDAPGNGVPQSLYATTCDYAESHPDEVKAFCRAAQEVRNWALDSANRDVLVSRVAEFAGLDAESAAEAWDTTYDTVWPADVSLTEEIWDSQALWYGQAPPAYDEYVSSDCQEAIADLS